MPARSPTSAFLAATLLSVLLFAPAPAGAAWPTNPSVNVPVSAVAGRFTNPQVAAPDSCGGIIVCWEDVGTSIAQIYVQRVDAFGQQRWALDGFPIAPPGAMQEFIDIASDGAGGAYVAWSDQKVAATMRDIFIQHVLAAGAVDPAWPAAGVIVCAAPADQTFPRVVPDGSGGAIVAWIDYRGNVDFAPDIFAQRISVTGAAMWVANGVPVIEAVGVQAGFDLASDGTGGLYVGWVDNRPGTYDVFAQHLAAPGGSQLWAAAGLVVCAEPGDQNDVAVTSDAGQMLIAWDDYRSGMSRKIYAQKLAPNGAIAWFANGALVGWGVPYDQLAPRITSDGLGGAIIAWSDYRFSGFDNAIFAQRVDASGSPVWTLSGVAVCMAPGRQLRPQIISDQVNGAIITWDDFRKNYPLESDADVFAQRLSAAGSVLWTVDGAVVSSAPNHQVGPVIVTDGAGGAVIAWQDQRRPGPPFDTDIYCQEIGAGGSVGVRGVSISCAPPGCGHGYTDFGDAPEGIVAYTDGVIGHFPTCINESAPGTRESPTQCPAIGTQPGPTGYVKHVQLASDPNAVWLGCTLSSPPPLFVDSENDGKFGVGGSSVSFCDPTVPLDCVETVSSGFFMGQDECYGDTDAGLTTRLSVTTCQSTPFDLNAYGCGSGQVLAYLNVLVDWNHDGDWNDVIPCPGGSTCAAEWQIVNQAVVINPGCNDVKGSLFAGPTAGTSWMRITISKDPVPPDFTWNGSVSAPGGALNGGETEDYPIDVVAPTGGVEPPSAPSVLWLAPTVPNPSSSGTIVRFSLSKPGAVSLDVFDMAGRRVRGLISSTLTSGPHAVAWDFRDDGGVQLPAGYFVVRLRAEGRSMTRPVIRTR